MSPAIESDAAPFPLIRVSASEPRARGRIMGEEARELIAESVSAYQETFAHYTGLGWERITEVALEFAAPIEAYDAAILIEIEGMAEGSGLGLGDLLALNARSEIMFGLNVPTPPECTAFFAGSKATADGHVLLGQNWDWRPRAIDSTALFEVDQGADRPSFLMLPEAGLIGKTGFNEHGIGVTLNAMVSDLDRGDRQVPIHVILRGILNSTTIDEAFTAIVRMRRGASANYTIAGPTGVGLVVEVGPGGVENVQVIKPTDDLLAHSNHFVSDIAFEDVGVGSWPDSLHRIETMRRFLVAHRGKLSTDAVKDVFRDDEGHPDAICRFPNPGQHPVEQSATVASMIMDLTARCADISAGVPDADSYVRYVPEFATLPSTAA